MDRINISEIKKWLTDPNERLIFVEDGKPVCVLLGFEAYSALKGKEKEKSTASASAQVASPWGQIGSKDDFINAELEAERIKEKELAAKLAMDQFRASSASPAETAQAVAAEIPANPPRIRLEDLPL